MNPGIGAPELLVIFILALVVVGPRDLPLMMRKLGRAIGQLRSMARDFQRSFEELGREAEMEELRKEIQALKNSNPVGDVSREIKAAENELRDLKVDRPHPRTGTFGGTARKVPKSDPGADAPPPSTTDGDAVDRAVAEDTEQMLPLDQREDRKTASGNDAS